MTEKQLKSVMDSITMPEAMAQELRKNVSGKKQKNRTFRYPKIAAAVIAGALILSVGTTLMPSIRRKISGYFLKRM